jgi:L-2-hydroxyglutarate oxidase LhgO
VASSISGGQAAAQVPRAYYCKGNYFTLDHGRHPFQHLVYPAPNNAGLGVHVTIDLAANGMPRRHKLFLAFVY